MPRNSTERNMDGENRERSGQLRPGRVRKSRTSSPRFTGVARNLLRLARLVNSLFTLYSTVFILLSNCS